MLPLACPALAGDSPVVSHLWGAVMRIVSHSMSVSLPIFLDHATPAPRAASCRIDRDMHMLNGNAPGPYFCIVAIGLYYLNFIFIYFY